MSETPPVTILYFAHAARAAGVESEEFVLEGPQSLDAIKKLVLARRPGLQSMAKALLWAVDEAMPEAGAQVAPGQTVGVMPPFSGG